MSAVIMMIGTPESAIEEATPRAAPRRLPCPASPPAWPPPAIPPSRARRATVPQMVAAGENAPDVLDDLDLPSAEVALLVAQRPENVAKLLRRVAATPVAPLAPPRPGKKLLVLDIDYTLFDHRTPAERPEELARPHLHAFLAAAHASYDIVIWSATSMRWVELKMRELGVLNHAEYSITAMLDHQAMITVQTERHGVFDCKPLRFLWEKFPGIYSEQNTIMFDDLRRNFAMNPRNGLKIRPFRNAHQNRRAPLRPGGRGGTGEGGGGALGRGSVAPDPDRSRRARVPTLSERRTTS